MMLVSALLPKNTKTCLSSTACFLVQDSKNRKCIQLQSNDQSFTEVSDFVN